MSHEAESFAPAPLQLALPAALPPANAREPEELIRFREDPHNDAELERLREHFSQQGDDANLMLLCWIRGDADPHPARGAQWLDHAAQLALEKLQDGPAALRILSRRLQRGPALTPVLRMRTLLAQQGDERALQTLLTWAFEVDLPDATPPELSQLSAELGDLHLKQSQLHLATCAYRRALAYDPGCISAIDALSDQLLRAGAWEDASRVLRGALAEPSAAQDPNQVARYHLRLAHIDAAGNQDKAGAASHLKAALDALPGDLDIMLQLSELLDHDDGSPVDPNTPTLWAKTARIAVEGGKTEVARYLLERALTVSPDAAALRREYREILRVAGDHRALVLELQNGLAALSEHPQARAQIHIECAEIYAQQLRQPLLAMEHWETALALAPMAESSEPAWESLLRSHRDEGDWEQIAELLRRRIEAGKSPDPYHDRLDLARIYREQLDEPTRAVRVDHQILSEHDLFDPAVSASYKEYFRNRNEWSELQEAVLFRIQEAEDRGKDAHPLNAPEFAEEFVELADICERRLGDLSGAIDAWQRLGASYPDDPRPNEQIERLQKRSQVWDSMLANHEQDLANAKDSKARAGLLKRYAQIHRDRYRDPSAAIALASEYLQLVPDDAAMRRMMLSLYEREGDPTKIAEVLEQQLEHGTNPAERLSILRRLCNLYHRQLRQFDKAIEACESQLEIAPRSLEALRRIEQIHRRCENTSAEIEAVERQLELVGRGDQQSMLLRRLARAKARDKAPALERIEIWERIQNLEPQNALVLERLLQLAVEMGDAHRVEQTLQSIADRLNAYPAAKVARLVELACWATHELQDPDAAEEAWTRVLAIDPHHRRALAEVVKLKTERDEVEGLLGALGTQAQVAPTKGLRDHAQWQRVTLLAQRQGAFDDAIEILDQLRADTPQAPRRIHQQRLDYLEQTDNTREIAQECEVGLLAEMQNDQRVRLYRRIERAYLECDDIEQSVDIAQRYTEEFNADKEGFARLSELNLQLGRLDPALVALTQRRELFQNLDDVREADVHMAQLCEEHDAFDRAWEFLEHPLSVDLEDEETWDNLRAYSDRHEDYNKYMATLARRLEAREARNNQEGARALYLEASWIQEQQFNDANAAFEWASRGYMRYTDASENREELRLRLWSLAEAHGGHEGLLNILERELERRRQAQAYDGIDGAYLEAARVAQVTLDQPARAIDILERGLQHLDLHGPVAQALDEVSRQCGQYKALETLYQRRIAGAKSPDALLENYLNFVDLCERELANPPRALTLALQAWDELRQHPTPNVAVSEQALERALALGREHQLYTELAKLYDRLARYSLDDKEIDEGLEHALECANILHQELGKPVESLRTLLAYLSYDRDGERLLTPIRELCRIVEAEGRFANTLLGPLAQLMATAQVLGTTDQQDLRIELLSERAALREEKVTSAQGPVVEWLRVLELNPENQHARAEIDRLCEDSSRDRLALFRPAWELQNAQSATQKSDLLHELADLYEQRLERNEYAFRARLQAYRLTPWLPEPEALGDEQQKLWDLAAAVGDYRGPALPEDALLRPRLSIPERSDEQRWTQLGFSVATFLDRSKGLPHAPQELADLHDEEVEVEAEIVELEDLEELVELEDEHLEAEIDDPALLEQSAALFSNPTLQIPPPVAKSLVPGHPVVPTLQGPILGRRPRVDSAWQELSDAYASLATGSPDRDAQVLVLQACMWEQSAKHVEAAFQAHEHALVRNPGDPGATASIEALAARHDAQERLTQSIRFLFRRAPSDEVAIDLALRLADLSLEQEDTETAIQCYRDIIARDAQHIESLEALSRIYKERGDHAKYSEIYAQKLEVERHSLSAQERIERGLHLADNYASNLGRTGDAISTLRSLVDDHPDSIIAQDRLIDILKDAGQWSQAVEAMRNAADHSPDQTRRRALLASAASIYHKELKLPDRAIDIWQNYRELNPDDAQATIELENLYLETQRYEQLVAILESADPTSDQAEQLRRLLVKGLALSEGLQDQSRARGVFDDLSPLLPLRAEHLPSYARFVRGLDLPEKAISVLRTSMQEAEPTDLFAFFDTWKSLRDLAPASVSDLVDSLDNSRQAHPQDQRLLRMRIDFARERNEHDTLIDLLTQTERGEDSIEASERCLGRPDAIERAQSLLDKARSQLGDQASPQLTARMARVHFQIALAQREQTLPALRTLDEALTKIEDDHTAADYWVEAADALAQHPEHAKLAARAYELALERSPSHAKARLQLAQLAVSQGDPERAETMLSEITRRPPAPEQQDLFVQASIALAKLKSDQGQNDVARATLQQSFRLLPTKIPLRVALAEQCAAQSRWTDLLSSADQLDTQLAREPETDPELLPSIARLYELSAQAEQSLGRPKAALARLQTACKYSPDNPEILLSVVQQANELKRSEDAVAARERLACVYGTQPSKAGHQLLLGALELLESANRPEASPNRKGRGSGHTLESESGLDRVEQRQARAVRLLDSSLGQLRKVQETEALPFEDLERALRRCSAIAPRCVPQLIALAVRSEDMAPARRFELHLQAAQMLNERVGQEKQGSQEQAEGLDNSALHHATQATRLKPASSRAQLCRVQALDAAGDADAAKQALLEVLDLRPQGEEVDPQDEAEKLASIELLRRIAQEVDAQDPKLLDSLFRIHQLVPDGLSIQERHRLADAQSLHPEHPLATPARVYENCAALVRLDPTSIEHLEQVLEAQREQQDPAAVLTEQVLYCAKGDNDKVLELEGALSPLCLSVQEPLAQGREIAAEPFATAFRTLWQQARELVLEHMSDGPRWTPNKLLDPSEIQDRPIGVALARAKLQVPDEDKALSAYLASDVPLEQGIVFRAEADPWLAVHPDLVESQDLAALTFQWTRALVHAKADNALICGLDESVHADLISAILLAFHPRHTRRRHQARQNDDRASQLGLSLVRKVPIRSARAVTKAFKDAPYAFFASEQWSHQVHQEARKLALLCSGSIRAAVPGASAQAWSDACRQDSQVRALTAFFLGSRYSEIRSEGLEP